MAASQRCSTVISPSSRNSGPASRLHAVDQDSIRPRPTRCTGSVGDSSAAPSSPGRQGRLVIPADVRTALGLAPGDRLHLHLAGRRIVLERQQDAVAELRGMGSNVPKTRSLDRPPLEGAAGTCAGRGVSTTRRRSDTHQ
ncbi:AbrB/MazE/SpoVT family DNA-binding domain-containing protein [Rhodococcus sp. WS4]|nr:AbrB/MazE/SpoVT family DNA-binding domain-containing protein [Rhodococcus sp. WS4]